MKNNLIGRVLTEDQLRKINAIEIEDDFRFYQIENKFYVLKRKEPFGGERKYQVIYKFEND